MNLSPNFTLAELTHSDAAARQGHTMEVTEEHIANLRRLAQDILQPIRDLVGVPVLVNSGYRDETINRFVGGSLKSAHMDARAADIRVSGMPASELAHIIEGTNLSYDKMILEFDSWVHIQIAKLGSMPRQRILTAKAADTGAVYTLGIS